MSKSKGNIVDPDGIIKKYGADTLRLYILFAGPPETEMEWNDRGIEGSSRFLNRVWRLVEQKPGSGTPTKEEERRIHLAIKRVTDDIEKFHFNTAISAIMELVNFAYQAPPTKTMLEAIVMLLSPFTPHICEEMWKSLGYKQSILKASWPKYNPDILKQKEAVIIVQINGKMRARLNLPVDLNEEKLKEIVLSEASVTKWIEDKPVKKFIVVPNKLANIVI
ncbi:MAG: class I tRNA ligase family protein, partial [Candidatus Omnitrophica bacterium]|nr:class I tRNA ligase family protein [Candidatus Omnitrophota bacterium]